MSRKGIDTPPPGSNLLADFQTFCQSPAFITALQQNPLAAQMFQPLASTPSVPSLPENDYTINVRCISQHLSKSFSDTLLMFPDVQSTWEYYTINSKFPGYFNPIHFTSWIPAPPVIIPPTDNQLASNLFSKFRDDHPWSVFMKGIPSTDPNYPATLSLMGIINPLNPIPCVQENIVDSIPFVTFLQAMAEYYTNNGTASLESILRSHFDALKYSINKIKFPDYDISVSDTSYHLGWFMHYNNQFLVRNPHLLIQHFKTLAMAKSQIFSLNAHRTYLQSVIQFFKIFDPVLSVNVEKSFKDFKDLISLNLQPNYVGAYIKQLQTGCSDIKSFIQLIYEHEDTIIRLPPPTAVVPPLVPRDSKDKQLSPPVVPQPFQKKPNKGKSVFLRAPSYCLNPLCAKAEHSVRLCDQPCQLPGCPAPAFAHKARTCMILHDRDSAQALYATSVLNLPMSICTPFSPKSTPFARLRKRIHRVSRGPPLQCSVQSCPALPSSVLPAIKFDTGANVFVSPVPLSSAPITQIHDLIEVADGSCVPITGSSLVGSSPLLLAPSFSEALIPQSTIEHRGAFTVLLDGQLKIFNIATNKPLLEAVCAACPVLSTSANNGEYLLPAHSLCDFLSSDSPPSPYVNLTTKTASIARYYTSKFNSLKDLVLYWHVALDHASEQRMINIVQHKLIYGLPSQLTVPVIRKYFKRLPRCINCATATLQQTPDPPSKTTPLPPPGHSLYIDFAQPSGSPDTNSPSCVKAIGGYTHALNAIDLGTGRAFSFLTKSTKGALTYLTRIHKLHLSRGYTLLHLYIDLQLATTELRQYCSKHDIHVHIGVPYEHQSLGTVERFNRTIKESKDKKMLQSHISPNMWGLAHLDSVDLYNAGPSPVHASLSPYRLYDDITPDASASPFLPWGTHVVGHIPLALQTAQSGRGKEYLYVGRDLDNFGAVRLLNPVTGRVTTRRTFKVMGDHPVKNMIFDTPVGFLFDPSDDDDAVVHPTISPLPASSHQSPPAPIAVPSSSPPDTPASPPALHYRPANPSRVHPSQRKFFDNIGRSFAELSDDRKVIAQWTIADVVSSTSGGKQLYYKYYDSFSPIPLDVDDFEYSLCSVVNRQTWARFDVGEKIASAIRSSAQHKLPTNFPDMMRHPDAIPLLESFLVEWRSWYSNNCVKPLTVDPSSIHPDLIGDLMILWDVKYHSDGSFDKWKCRIVFRGDRWINVHHIPTYASSADVKGLLLLLSLAATLDWDLWAMDVKTAFLKSAFPDGIRQYVRRPYGVPDKYFPPLFELGKCVYGHPAASHQFELHNQGVYRNMGFLPLRSTPSMFQLPATSSTDQVVSAVITDDCIFATPFDSPMKQHVMSQFASHYEHTVKDPLVNINGCTLHRDRLNRRIGITQPLHLDNLSFKYPLAPGEQYPSVPFPYSDYVSAKDRAAMLTPFPPKDVRQFQSILGDILWLQRLSKPELVFAHQHLCRITNPTLFDYNIAIRVIHYCIGTKDDIRWLGGSHGPIITSSVDSSFASHPDLKSQSCWTIHVGGGGATICESKKQSITADSSTTAEVAGNALAYPDIQYASNIFEELGYPQPTALGIGNDNQSTMKLLQNPASKGKTRHLDLRYNILREKIELDIIRLFYIPTDHMIADIGTKALAPAVFLRLRSYLLGHTTLPQFIEYITQYAPQYLVDSSSPPSST